MDGFYAPSMFWGWGISLVLWILVIALVVWLVLRLTGPRAPGAGHRPSDSAEEALRQRFAAGEIDEEEYRRRLAILREGR